MGKQFDAVRSMAHAVVRSFDAIVGGMSTEWHSRCQSFLRARTIVPRLFKGTSGETSSTGSLGAAQARSPVELRIGVIGTYGNGNLGDECVFLAFLQWLEFNAPQVTPVPLCVNPPYIEQTYGVSGHAVSGHHTAAQQPPPKERRQSRVPMPAEPSGITRLHAALKRFFPAPIRLIRSAQAVAWDFLAIGKYWPHQMRVVSSLDAVAVLGGGQVHDFWDGPLGHPSTLFLWALACHLMRKPFLILSTGGVALEHPLSRWFIRRAFGWSMYASVRDKPTASVVRDQGLSDTRRVVPDLAWGLRAVHPLTHPAAQANLAGSPPEAPPRTIGLCPMVYGHPQLWPGGDADTYANYIAEMASFCSRLSREGYHVVIFPTQIRSDPVAVQDVVAQIDPQLMRCVRIWSVQTVADLLDCLGSVDAVVSSRFHGLLLSLLMGRPALSVSYQPKNTALLHELGESHLAIDIQRVSADVLWSAFVRLCDESAAYAAHIGAHVEDNRRQLDKQYRDILQQLG